MPPTPSANRRHLWTVGILMPGVSPALLCPPRCYLWVHRRALLSHQSAGFSAGPASTGLSEYQPAGDRREVALSSGWRQSDLPGSQSSHAKNGQDAGHQNARGPKDPGLGPRASRPLCSAGCICVLRGVRWHMQTPLL